MNLSPFQRGAAAHLKRALLALVLGVGARAFAGPTVDPSTPSYVPQAVEPPKEGGYLLPDGTLQIVGHSDMSGPVGKLDELFARSHPGFKFKYIGTNNRAAVYCMDFDSSVFCPVGTEFSGSHAYAIMVGGAPFAIRIAHATNHPGAQMSPPAIIVNKANPLGQLSTSQVARIFTTGIRQGDITRWGQLKLDGEWAGEEIRPCGLPWTDYYPSEDPDFGNFMFVSKMGNGGQMNGGQPAPSYSMVPNYSNVVRRVAADPHAIGITDLSHVTSEVKVLAIKGGDYAAASSGSAEDIVAGRYPYDRYLYIYVRRLPGKPFDPFVREYLRLALSREGQEAIAAEAHGYLPLNAVENAEERAKLQ